jgi:hypothetical protein
MCYDVNKRQYIINCNNNNNNNVYENNEAMVDVYSDMPPLIPLDRPNFEEINEMIKLHRAIKIEFNSEFAWFIGILSICFGGVAGIMRMVYLLKR